MTRKDQAPGELPTEHVPSAEVLDELLRAFSADDTDAATLERVDLASPEVEELLSASSPEPPAADAMPAAEAEPRPEHEPEVEGQVETTTTDVEPEPPSTAATRTIVIDAADSRPDAVYLAAGDPLLARSAGGRAAETPRPDDTSGGSPVFIDDAAVESGETITIADASSATRIEPRLRERRIAVKRAAGRKRLRWVLLAVAVLVIVVAVLAVLGSSLFAIDRVRVDGAVQTDPAHLQAVIDELEGTPVLRADTDAAERQLEAIPWVADARVTTQFPDGATIEVREREPVASFQGPDQRFRLIDLEGRVLQVFDGEPIEFMVISSADAVDLEAGQFAAQGIVAAANLVQALTPDMRALAVGVSATGDGSDLRLLLTDEREVRFGPGRDLVVKLVRLQTKLDELAGSGFRFVDVSTDEVTTG